MNLPCVRVIDNEVVSEYPNGLPAKVTWCDDRPYYNATQRHASDGIMPATFTETPDGMVKTGHTWTEVDGVIVETGEYITQAEYDAQQLAEWQASEEYASRVKAVQIITAIQGTLSTIEITPDEKAQVFADVDTWVQASENDSEKISRLETAMRLQTYYVSLIELVGDATGLINGEREIDLTLGG